MVEPTSLYCTISTTGVLLLPLRCTSSAEFKVPRMSIEHWRLVTDMGEPVSDIVRREQDPTAIDGKRRILLKRVPHAPLASLSPCLAMTARSYNSLDTSKRDGRHLCIRLRTSGDRGC